MDRHQRHLGDVRSLYDSWSPAFQRCAGWTHQTVLLPVGVTPRDTNLEMARRLGMDRVTRLLDAGCGVGGPAVDVADHWPHVAIDAVTLSAVQAELATHNFAQSGHLGRLRAHAGDFHALPFEAATFDAAWLLESACYSPSPRRLLAELWRVVRPGGQVYLKDLFLDPTKGDPAARRDLHSLRQLWSLPRLWPLATWQRLARRQGFAVTQAALLHGATHHWYAGAMLELTATGIELNEFGRHFYVSADHAPIEWAELLLTKPMPPGAGS